MEASDGTTQRGNDIDSTSFTGGGLQATNTENVTLTSQASSFGFTTGGTYKIKISLFENDSQSGTPIKTALTDSFQTFSVQEFTSTFKGVDTGEGTFIGYVSKLLAAENNSSTEGTANRTISQAISGAKLFAFNLNAASVVARNNDLSTTFNGNEESGQNFFHTDGSVIQINGSDGVIDSVTDATPATPTIASSSFTSNSILIRVTGNTEVTRNFNTSITPSGGSESTANHTVSSQTTSHTQDITFSSLDSSKSHAIKVRGTNEAENGAFSSIVNITTSAPVTSVSTSESAFDLELTDFDTMFTSATKTFSITNPSGNTTVTAPEVGSGDSLPAQFAATNDGSTPSSFTGIGNTITLGSSTSVNVRVRCEIDDEISFGDEMTRDITVTNNGKSATLRVTFRSSAGGKCVDSTMLLNMIDGLRHISTVVDGDMVSSYNIEKNITEYVKINRIIKVQHDNVYRIKLDDNSEMLMTDDHPIISKDNRLLTIDTKGALQKYNMKTDEIRIGDVINKSDGYANVIDIERVDGMRETYTVITDNQNFYANGILVHQGIEDLSILDK